MFEGHHYQVAYVTRNLDKAVSDFKGRAPVRHESLFEIEQPVSGPAIGSRIMRQKLALLWVGNVQYEFIEPISGMADIYGAALPVDDSWGFHHICARVPDWEAFRSRVDGQSLPLVFEGEAGPLKFLYLDGRTVCGHYLEYTWIPEDMWSDMGGM